MPGAGRRQELRWLPAVIVIGGIGAVSLTFWMNSQPAPTPVSVVPPASVFESPPAPAAPVVAFPDNGSRVDHTRLENVAPFEVSSEGKTSNFLVRLRDAETGALITDLYLRPGRTAKVSVPLGRFRLLIASGSVWYGTELLFGDKGGYSEAEDRLDFTQTTDRVRGHTIRLQESVLGNLKVRSIRRLAF
jgi:hypothetical protein